MSVQKSLETYWRHLVSFIITILLTVVWSRYLIDYKDNKRDLFFKKIYYLDVFDIFLWVSPCLSDGKHAYVWPWIIRNHFTVIVTNKNSSLDLFLLKSDAEILLLIWSLTNFGSSLAERRKCIKRLQDQIEAESARIWYDVKPTKPGDTVR